MSLRSEYSHAFVFNDADRKWEVTAFNHETGKARVIGRESVNFEFEIQEAANRLISAHMEKVTRMLEGEPIKAQRSQFDPREDPTESENEI